MNFVLYSNRKKLFKINGLLFFTFIIFIFLQSCALTNSQVKITKQFYNSVGDIGRQCKVLNESANKVTFERRLLSSESYTADSNIVSELVENYEIYYDEVSSIDSFNLSVCQLETYLNGFSKLLPVQKSNAPNYERKVLSAVENFSSYLPFGIGLTIYKTIYDLVSYTARFIKVPHTRKIMKKHIMKGENLVAEDTELILKELLVTSKKLEKEKELIKLNYLQFLKNQKENKSPFDYYQIYNPIFLKKYHLAFTSLELSNALILLIPEVKKAYETLYSETKERKRIKNEFSEFSKMFSAIESTSRHALIVNEALKNNKSE